MKTCGTCQVQLDLSEFNKSKSEPDGLHFRCKRCEWSNQIKRKYGISGDEYYEILTRQGGGCAICGKIPTGKRLAVDHDHACCPGSKNGKTCGECRRGILCEDCNHMIGKAKDSINTLRSAIKYLESYEASE